MDTITLTRTGTTPLRFTGETIARSDGQECQGKQQVRWHNLTLYRTEGGNYVLHVEYKTTWRGELGHSNALQVSPATVGEAIAGYDCTAYVQGFPPTPQHADRQANLLAWIRRMFDNQVSELLSAAGDIGETIA